MTASGVVMSYPWANDLVYRLTGSPVPVRGAGPAGPAARVRGRGGQVARVTRRRVASVKAAVARRLPTPQRVRTRP